MPLPDFRPEAAEAAGVFALVFAGCGAIMANATTGALGHVGIALTFAFVITVLIYALGHICGAHYNPAITLAFAATGHFPWRRVPTYLAAQSIGATAAAFLLLVLLGPIASVGATTLSNGVAPWKAFVVEALATSLLALVIIGVATDKRAAPGAAGLAIGLTVGVGALFAGPLTGGSMNPARSLGPALAAGAFENLWIYLAAPAVGAVAAMTFYELIRPGRLAIHAREPMGAPGPVQLSESEETKEAA